MRKNQHPVLWAVLSGAFGLLFGLMCTPVYWVIGGAEYALSWWVAGLLADILHCAGNFVIALLLFVPLRSLVAKLYATAIK